MQHIVFNAQQEIELIETWKPFWNDLKNVERFMRLKERRDRYFHTCLLGGPLASHANSFERWSNTLYTNRWHEVVRFCKHLEKVLVVLASTFDETKYAGGATKQGEEDDERGVNAFDVKQLARSFQDPLFQKTVSGVILVQSLPEDLAAKLSRCPCHEFAYKRLNANRMRRLSQKLFGGRSCPANGCWAPECAAGCVEDFLEQLWKLRLHEFLAQPPRLSAKDQVTLLQDLEEQRSRLCLAIKTKFAFTQELPALLCGLAHVDETTARDCAFRAQRIYQSKPQSCMQHPLAHAYVGDPVIANDMQRFIDGASRMELPSSFQEACFKFRWVPCNETPAEEKHARVNLEPH